ncbi:MAG TPA: PIN domain-containing protein [Candidatus Ruania gallistercoris]|uniref:PIN domain-containing protein n=1 Tax=Candidatus Ruania gallistercoris TaxID=2838746 RepID=A0A9D2J6C5_9MICO|nr:PIN domain-containing protein [Candidatus Ruania gallistercoris]
MLSTFHIEPITESTARRAGEFQRTYRRSRHTIGTVDYLIAATAVVNGYALATLNVRHFPMFADLEPPFQP